MAERLEFDGAAGRRLAGLVDTPVGPARASAIFAHCFSCGKDSIAAARIARGLTDRGFTVLRFDVTGLGESEGEFGEATFSMDVADMVTAAGVLRERGQAPGLLVGHSLGGAAAIAAAAKIPESRAVATIAAPAEPSHVTDLLARQVPDLLDRDEVEVQLGNRTFTLRREFLEDLRSQPQRERIATLGRALLVMHSPQDRTVSIDNATAIFMAARHPKSFISLDGANHLLTGRDDARYVADVLAAWASRYLDDAEPRPTA